MNKTERIASQSHRRGMSAPDYDYIELDAPVMDTCYGMLNILTCCMVQTCFSPAIIRVKNRMATRGWTFVDDCPSGIGHFRTLIFRRRRTHTTGHLPLTNFDREDKAT